MSTANSTPPVEQIAFGILADSAPCRCGPPDSPLCRCGHTAHWHSHSGTGDCEHDGKCRCKRFVPTMTLVAS